MWGKQAVVLTTAKLQKLGWVNFWQSSSKLSWSTYPEIFMVCETMMPLKVPIKVFALFGGEYLFSPISLY